MASATINRPVGGVINSARATRFGDFPSTGGRINLDEKSTQNTALGQGFASNNAWKASGTIWGNGNAIGSGYTVGKRDVSRSRVTDDDVFNGPSGSGALAASSEADPWGSRTSGPWNVDPTSPNHSGNTSPARHRGSNASAATNSILSESQKTSPYLVTSRPAIGQGPGLSTRSVQKSNLDPASGPFKYPYGSLVFGENKENGSVQALNGRLDVQDGFIFDQRAGLGSAYRGTQTTTSREPSLPPSRRSETASSGATNGSIFSNGAYSAFGHTPQNSVHMQRPTLPSRAPSFGATTNGRRLSTSTDRIQDTDISYTHGNFLEKSLQVTFPESSMAATEQPLSSLGTYPGYDSVYRGNTRARDTQFAANGYPESAYSSQLNSGKVSRASDREALSTFNDRRNQPMSPKYYNANGSATTSELDNACTRAQQAQNFSELDRNLQRLQLSQPQQSLYYGPHGMYTGQFQGQYPPQPWDFTSQQYRPTSQGYVPYSVQLPSYTPVSVPRGPARDQDVGHGVRSLLLEEFRNNTKSNTRRYDLKDIYGHVVEFSGDQHGSRFIQSKLETANSDEKDQIFREIQPNALQLMTDVFGNYVIQKLFEHGNQIQKKMLAEIMKNHVNELSLQMYGCRVVQKALEHVLADQQAELVKELQSEVLRYVKDQNGNHVVQKAIERCPTEHVQFILDAFRGQVHTLATHPYGCRVIQRMLEYCSEKDQASILEELFACAQMLIIDQYGNYVVQHVIQHGKPEDQTALIKMVTAQVLTLSKHKFASNVVERSIVCGSDEQRRAILVQITALNSDGSSPLQLMMKDQYGNYVIQKLLGQLKGGERERFIEDIKPQLNQLRKYNHGKQIAAIEKFIFNGPVAPPHRSAPFTPQQNRGVVSPQASTTAMPIDITNSSAPTPMLTMEQNSPQSSSLPSTTASTIDDANDHTRPASKILGDGKAMPEVRIEAV